jgi:hypothetical protein
VSGFFLPGGARSPELRHAEKELLAVVKEKYSTRQPELARCTPTGHAERISIGMPASSNLANCLGGTGRLK